MMQWVLVVDIYVPWKFTQSLPFVVAYLVNKYMVTVYTGDKSDAGTNARVYVTIFGENGDSGEKRIDNPENNFERGQ